jgi:peptidoglycan-associated lipoprotein
MSQRKVLLVLLLSVGLVFGVGGCKKKPAPVEPPPPPPPVEKPAPTPPPVEVKPPKIEKPIVIEPSIEEVIQKLNADGVLKTVYFDFDKSTLTETSRATLRQNADWLRANPDYKVVIEGHCDERGTIEYNLALGERRARATKEFLTSLGVNGSNLRLVSYGEERPAKEGHDDSAWSKNRRAAFWIESKG